MKKETEFFTVVWTYNGDPRYMVGNTGYTAWGVAGWPTKKEAAEGAAKWICEMLCPNEGLSASTLTKQLLSGEVKGCFDTSSKGCSKSLADISATIFLQKFVPFFENE